MNAVSAENDRGWAALLGILTLAFVLRLTGVWFGLPFSYHADEPIVVHHALAYGAGDLNPHFFRIPPLISYLLFGCYGLIFVFGKLTGIFSGLPEFEKLFFRDPSMFYLTGRLIFGVLLGTATVYFYDRLLRRISAGFVATAAALLLAVNPLHVRDSHYLYADIPLLLVMVLFFLSLFSSEEKFGRTGTHVKLGVWIGLASAVKYNGCLLAVPYLISWWRLAPKDKKTGTLLSCFSAAGLTCAALNPFSLIDFRFFTQEMIREAAAHGGAGWTHHLVYSLASAMGWPLVAAAMGGIAYAMFRGNSWERNLAIFTVTYYVVLVAGGQLASRYVLPLVPWVIVFGVAFIVRLSQWAWRGRARVLAILLLGLIAVPSALASLLIGVLAAKPDTRTLAKNWVETHLPADSGVALDQDFFAPRLNFSRPQLEEKRDSLSEGGELSGVRKRRLDYLLASETVRGRTYRLYFLNARPDNPDRPLFARPLLPFDLDELRRRGIEYVIASVASADQLPFYRRLEREAELMAVFSPYREGKGTPDALLDPVEVTGLPLAYDDLSARKSAGPPVRIFRLKN